VGSYRVDCSLYRVWYADGPKQGAVALSGRRTGHTYPQYSDIWYNA
jgi:hypothetical protein